MVNQCWFMFSHDLFESFWSKRLRKQVPGNALLYIDVFFFYLLALMMKNKSLFRPQSTKNYLMYGLFVIKCISSILWLFLIPYEVFNQTVVFSQTNTFGNTSIINKLKKKSNDYGIQFWRWTTSIRGVYYKITQSIHFFYFQDSVFTKYVDLTIIKTII